MTAPRCARLDLSRGRTKNRTFKIVVVMFMMMEGLMITLSWQRDVACLRERITLTPMKPSTLGMILSVEETRRRLSDGRLVHGVRNLSVCCHSIIVEHANISKSFRKSHASNHRGRSKRQTPPNKESREAFNVSLLWMSGISGLRY